MEDMMAKRASRAKTKQVASGDDAPDTKRSTKDQQQAAERLFQGADGAQRNEEQHENHVRRAALGY
jgi:uncharacterized protein (DUF2345 family)